MEKQKHESQETEPENPTPEEIEKETPEKIENQNEEPDPVDIPDKRDYKSNQALDCEFLGGNYIPQNKSCTIEKIDDDVNKYIFGIKQQHSKKSHNEQDSEFKLKYWDERGYRKELKTDIKTASIWVTKNKQKIKPEIYKGNKSYLFKEKVIE